MNLILLFGERLSLAHAPEAELASFVAEGVRYENVCAGYLTSFYDRLADPGGRLVGIVLTCVPEETGLGAALAGLVRHGYLDAVDTSRPCLAYQVHFTGTRTIGTTRGGEQAFGGSVFRSSLGVAVSIDFEYLCGGPGYEADLAALQSAPTPWVTLCEATAVA